MKYMYRYYQSDTIRSEFEISCYIFSNIRIDCNKFIKTNFMLNIPGNASVYLLFLYLFLYTNALTYKNVHLRGERSLGINFILNNVIFQLKKPESLIMKHNVLSTTDL